MEMSEHAPAAARQNGIEKKKKYTTDSMRTTSPDGGSRYVAQFGRGAVPHGGDMSPAEERTDGSLCGDRQRLLGRLSCPSSSWMYFPMGGEQRRFIVLYHVLKTNHALKKPDRGLFRCLGPVEQTEV